MRIVLTEKERKAWEDAFERWGERHQAIMAIEESAEVIVAVAHYERGRVPINKVLDEFGDAFVCVGQVIYSDCQNPQFNMEQAIEKSFSKLLAKLEADDKNQGEGR